MSTDPMTKQIEGLVARLRFAADPDWAPTSSDVHNMRAAMNEAADYIESTRSGVVDEAGMREILAQEMDRQDFREQAAWARQNMPSAIVDACLSAMRRVSKTDEGRNGVSDATITAALQAFDTGVGDPNDYRKRMRAALEAANLCGRNPQTDSREG